MPPAGALRLRDGRGPTGDRASVVGGCRGAPNPPAIDPGKPSSRGPGRQGHSYGGALHLDALNHARSTGVRADGSRDGSQPSCGCDELKVRSWAGRDGGPWPQRSSPTLNKNQPFTPFGTDARPSPVRSADETNSGAYWRRPGIGQYLSLALDFRRAVGRTDQHSVSCERCDGRRTPYEDCRACERALR
jgi:hypothetical protein